MRTLVASLLFIVVAAPASAQSATCVKVGNAVCGVTTEPRVAATTGDVRVSRGGSFARAMDGSSLAVGDRIFIGNGGGAVRLGPCNVDLKPYTVVLLAPGGGGMCVASLSGEAATRDQALAPMQLQSSVAVASAAPVTLPASAVQRQPVLAAPLPPPAPARQPAIGDRSVSAPPAPPAEVTQAPGSYQPDPYRGLIGQAPNPVTPPAGVLAGTSGALMAAGLAIAVGAGAAAALAVSSKNEKEQTASP